jgi:hypothetical protein
MDINRVRTSEGILNGFGGEEREHWESLQVVLTARLGDDMTVGVLLNKVPGNSLYTL